METNESERIEALLTVKECAAALSCHPQTILAMLKDGRLRGFQIGPVKGSHWRVSRADLAAFLAAGEAD